MRHQILVRSFVLVVAIVVAGSQAAAEGQGRDRGSQERDGGSEGQDRGSRQGAAAGLVVPIVGTTSAGGTFSGTLTVQRFIARGGNIFAVGLVTGAVTVPGQPVGTLLNGPKEIPVIVSQGTSAGLAPSSSMIRPVGGLGRRAPRGLILVQAQQTCGVLHLDLGTTTLNALGLTITTSHARHLGQLGRCARQPRVPGPRPAQQCRQPRRRAQPAPRCAGWGAWWIDRRSRRVTDHSRFRGAGPRVPAPMPSHLFSPAGARASASRTAEALTGLLEAAHRRVALAAGPTA